MDRPATFRQVAMFSALILAQGSYGFVATTYWLCVAAWLALPFFRKQAR